MIIKLIILQEQLSYDAVPFFNDINKPIENDAVNDTFENDDINATTEAK